MRTLHTTYRAIEVSISTFSGLVELYEMNAVAWNALRLNVPFDCCCFFFNSTSLFLYVTHFLCMCMWSQFIMLLKHHSNLSVAQVWLRKSVWMWNTCPSTEIPSLTLKIENRKKMKKSFPIKNIKVFDEEN